MKNAFTMIELIFVIVIIGILAAVAIPKLVSTRDDAKISQELSNLAIYVEDIATYYTATGNATGNHTNVQLHCFAPDVNETNGTMTISIANGGDRDGESYCTKAQTDAQRKGLSGDHLLTIGGNLVSY